MSARDVIRFEEAIANATSEFVGMWMGACNERNHLPHTDTMPQNVEALIEEHSFTINHRLREILHTLQENQRTTQSRELLTVFRNEVRNALLSTRLKEETVDNLIYAATP
jgi:hypothetical protein